MKLLWVVLAATLSVSALADEPSVRYECDEGFKSYSLNDKARFDVCPVSDNTIKADIVAIGGNYHSCWWMITATEQSEGTYTVSDSDCSVSFSITDDKLEASFTGACRYFCGARAFFSSGTYQLKQD